MQQFFVRSTGEDCFGRTVLKFVLDRCFWLATVTKLISRYVSRMRKSVKIHHVSSIVIAFCLPTLQRTRVPHYSPLLFFHAPPSLNLPCCFFTRLLHWTYCTVLLEPLTLPTYLPVPYLSPSFLLPTCPCTLWHSPQCAPTWLPQRKPTVKHACQPHWQHQQPPCYK
jgi:hypothetical protein